ncbi:MAG: RHS repeat domain-containing protein [Betaproteobacteria bacterium]
MPKEDSPATAAAGWRFVGGRVVSTSVSDAVADLVWDVRNRLVEIRQGASTVASFQYDALGRRSAKTIGGATTKFLYDGQSWPHSSEQRTGSDKWILCG